MSEQNPETKIQANNKLNMVVLSLFVIFLCGYGSIFLYPQKVVDYVTPAPDELITYFNILKYLRIIGFVIPFIFGALATLAFKKQKKSKSDDEFFEILLTAVGIVDLYISGVVAVFGRMYLYTTSDSMFSGLNHLAVSFTATIPFIILGLFLASKSRRKKLWWWIGLSQFRNIAWN